MCKLECSRFACTPMQSDQHHAWIQMGGDRRSGPPPPPPPPLKNHKNIGFVGKTGPDPLKITKLSSQHLMLGHHCHRHASETPFKWRFAGRLIMAPYSGILILPPLIKLKKIKTKQKKGCQSWTHFEKNFGIGACRFAYTPMQSDQHV